MKFVDWLESLTFTQFFSLCLLMSLISSFCFTATISPSDPLWQSIPLVRMYQNAVNVREHGLENDFSFYGITFWRGKHQDLSPIGNPVLLSTGVTSSKSSESLGSLSFTFTNNTMQGSAALPSWENSDVTTRLWSIILDGTIRDLELLAAHDPKAIHARSGDGRGPLWWAYEYGRDDIVEYLVDEGVDENAADKEGFVAKDMKSLFEKFHSKN